MNAIELSALIRSQVGEQWSRTDWPHGVVLARCLVNPPILSYFEASWERSEKLSLWLVLEENPGTAEGYLIAFDEAEGSFGLQCDLVVASSSLGTMATS